MSNRSFMQHMNKKRLALYAVFSAVAILASTIIAMELYSQARNYLGYCHSNDKRLSSGGRLNLAIEHYLLNQATINLLEIRDIERKNNPPIEELEAEFSPVSYQTKEEFLSINPSCCKLVWILPEGERIDFWRKASGIGNGYFFFSHKIKYTNQEGEEKTISAKSTYYEVTNCGKASYKHYY